MLEPTPSTLATLRARRERRATAGPAPPQRQPQRRYLGVARGRILFAAADLFRRHSYNGVGLKRVAADSGIAYGSLYHFYPGGKRELAGEVIGFGERYLVHLFAASAGEHADVVAGVRAFFALATQRLKDSDYSEGCPLATIALEVASSEDCLRREVARAFAGWIEAFTRYFHRRGIPEPQDRVLAVRMLLELEGALLLSRTLRSTTPLHIAADAAADAVADAVGRAQQAPGPPGA